VIQIFFSDRFSLPSFSYSISDGRESHLHNKLRNGARQRAGRALEDRPTKSVPEDRRKEDENYYGKDKVIKKLSYKGRYVCSDRIGKASVGMFAKTLSQEPIQRVVDERGGEKCYRTAKQNKPRSSEDAVKDGIVVCV
jgi:hypothetical protein